MKHISDGDLDNEPIIPADYIYAADSEVSKNRQTVILVHGLGDNRYSNYPLSNMATGIPTSYLAWCGNIVNRLKLGFSYQDADVAKAMKDVSTPVLIINSELDAVTPRFMGEDIYDAIPGDGKEIWTVDDSAHCEIWLDHHREYCERIESFLE